MNKIKRRSTTIIQIGKNRELWDILKDDFEIRHMPPFKIAKSIDATFLRVISLFDDKELDASKRLQNLLDSHGYETTLSDGFGKTITEHEVILKNSRRRYDLIATKDDVTFVFDIKIESKNRKRFKRLFKKRLEATIWNIRSVGKLSNKSHYNYRGREIKALRNTLLKEIDSAIAMFNISDNDETFEVKSNPLKLKDNQSYTFLEIEKLLNKQKELQEEMSLLSQKIGMSLREIEDNNN